MEIFMKAGKNINSIEHIFALYGFLSSSQKFSRSLRSLDCILPVRKLGMNVTTLPQLYCLIFSALLSLTVSFQNTLKYA